jgi:RimJ/RimL family protein N-acetyltransferase
MSPIDETTHADHDVQLKGERVLLRAFRLDDAEAVYEAVCESKAELAPWMPWCHPEYSINDTIDFLKKRGEAFQTTSEYTFAVVERSTGRLVGATGINEYSPAKLAANHGYWLRTGATGRGYATEASRLVTRWVFTAIELERLEIMVAVGNLRSQRVAERVGAVREGMLRKSLRMHGVQHDAVVYSLVRGDL